MKRFPDIGSRSLSKRNFLFLAICLFCVISSSPLVYPQSMNGKETFVMLSGYGLYPKINNAGNVHSVALSQALDDLARNHVAGIVYGTLGAAEDRLRQGKEGTENELAYNTALFQLARSKGANVWLQLRYYDNVLALPAGSRNATAPDILSDGTIRAVFMSAVMAAVDNYYHEFPKVCTIVLGEEETIYHGEMGSGLFWAGETEWNNEGNAKSEADNGNISLKRDTHLDELFRDNFAAINQLMIASIRRKYPSCRIGIHIGHAPLTQKIRGIPVYRLILDKLGAPGRLDFTFYDLYEKISKNRAAYEANLQERLQLLKGMGQTVFYLAQLQTTNNFGHGFGRTPSAKDIDRTFAIAQAANIDGFGYYTKDAAPTVCMRSTIESGFWVNPRDPSKHISTEGCNREEDLNPLDPNAEGQQMVYENAQKRWQYGLSKLVEFQRK
jgi:hypothetical protein